MNELRHIISGQLPHGWRAAIVNDIVSLERHSCVAGPFGSSISSKFFVNRGVPVIRGGNLSVGSTKFIDDGFVFVSAEQALNYKPQTVRAGDLIFTCWGTIGQVGIIPQKSNFEHYIISNKQLKLRVNVDIIRPVFAYYFFSSDRCISYIQNHAIGAAVPGINLGILKSLPVVLPPLNAQDEIISILSAYDDLIDNNTRRIAILEEMARRIFEEWFVHFRAPGCEGLRLVESSIGRVPHGWDLTRLDTVVEFDPRVRLPAGPRAFIPMTSLSTSSMIIGDVEERKEPTGSKFQNGDTLLARITPCLENGKTGFVDCLLDDEGGCGSTEFIVMRGKEVPSFFVQLLARSHRFRDHAIGSMSGATGRQRVRRDSLQQFEIALPPPKVLRSFDKVVFSIFALARKLADQCTNLRAQRNLLLPKLISGEIDVSAARAPLRVAAE